MDFSYTVFYTENGEKKNVDISLESSCQKPSTTQVFSKFKKLMGGAARIKKQKIFVKTIKTAI